ncbi:MAG: SDR family oxidoreductase, partial [Gammaproteobacteria bacterium]
MKRVLSAILTAAGILLAGILNPAAAADENTTVLITGANRGIGLEFARQFTEKGYAVIGTARSPDEAEELRDLDARIVELDVADSASVKAMAKALQGTKIDILINNAGISGHGAQSFRELDIDKLDWTFQVNSLGPMRVTQALHDNLLAGEGKKILHVSSIMGSIELNDRGGVYGYRMSKTALNMFNKSLSLELADKGFICVVLHPGWVQTDMGGEQAPLEPEESISGMIRVIEGLDDSDNGRFYDYTGKELPW